MAVEPVWSELVSPARSLMTREDAGKFPEIRQSGGARLPDVAFSWALRREFPKRRNSEIRGNEHGFSRRESSSRTSAPGLFRGSSIHHSTNTAGDELGFRQLPWVQALQLQRLQSRMS